MRAATLVASLTSRPSPEDLQALSAAVRWLEVRADLAGDLDPGWLRDRFPGKLLYSLRSRAEGGACEGSGAERRARLLAAARGYDLIDLETGDLGPEILSAIPAERRVVSWHGPAASLDELRHRWERLSATAARLYRLVPAAREAAGGLAPLRLLRETGRSDLTAFASGLAGWWSRLLAPRLGAPFVFAAAGEGEEDEPAVARLMSDYGLPALPAVETLYGIVGGRTVAKSLSPRLHNAAYRALGIPALYMPFQTPSFGAFWSELSDGALAGLGWPLEGLTVTAPYKEPALAAAPQASPIARRAGAANTLLRGHRTGWCADTADAEGVLAVLAARGIDVTGRRTAVVGCGGAGRAAAAGLQRAGAEVTLVNRSPERGQYASRLLGLPCVPLSDFSAAGFSLVVHATPVQREVPFPIEALAPGAVVVELVYGAAPTALMAATTARGGVAIEGREVLIVEACRQFQMMTGRTMPGELAVRLVHEGAGACASIPRSSDQSPSRRPSHEAGPHP